MKLTDAEILSDRLDDIKARYGNKLSDFFDDVERSDEEVRKRLPKKPSDYFYVRNLCQ